MKTDFNGKKILITGGAGFVGSNLAFYLQNNFQDSSITVIDKFQSEEKFPNGNFVALGHYKNLIGFTGKVVAADINCLEELAFLENENWDVIFHQAAISDTTVLDQNIVIKTNTNTLNYFIRLAKKNDAHLVYASSAGTYGNSESPNIIGKGELPENVYGFSKLSMDTFVRNELAKDPNLKITGLRYFNVYGNREFYKGKTASMILQLALQMLQGKKPKLFKHGEQSRDFIFIDDVVQANIKAVSSKSGIYNVGTGITRSFNDIIEILKTELNIDVEVEFIDNPYTFYQNNTKADITLSRNLLGYEPQFTLELGIAAYVKEIKNIAVKNNYA